MFLIFNLYNINLTAQEKQNDATWEETIGFINDNIKALRGNVTGETNTIETNLSNDKTILTVKNSSDGRIYIRSIDLNDLYFTRLDGSENGKHSNTYLLLWAREKDLINANLNGEITTCDFLSIGVESGEMKKRFLNAFIHLSSLAKEKYEENKSKSKF